MSSRSPSSLKSTAVENGHANVKSNDKALVSDPQLALKRLQRDDLFPCDVAGAHGLDPDNFSIIQLSDQSQLYEQTILYAAHFAVDLDTELPGPVSKSLAKATQSLATKKKSTKSLLTKKKSTEDGGNEADNEKEDNPSDAEDDHVAVAVSDDFPSYGTHTKEQLRERFVDKTKNGNLIARREGEGHLSTLLYGLRDEYEWSDSSSTNDKNNGSSDTSSSDDSDTDDDCTEGIRAYGLRNLSTQKVHRFRMGIGFSKMRVGDSVVLLHHIYIGDPFERAWNRPDMMMTAVLAGKSPVILKEACSLIRRWNQRRSEAVKNCGQHYFTLYRFRTKEDGGGGGKWHKQASKRSRSAKSIILRDGMINDIIDDVKDFVSKDTKSWYVKHGLPHRRSILFFGPPGCGKVRNCCSPYVYRFN